MSEHRVSVGAPVLVALSLVEEAASGAGGFALDLEQAARHVLKLELVHDAVGIHINRRLLAQSTCPSIRYKSVRCNLVMPTSL